MLDKVTDGKDIASATHQLLLKADAYGRWPTPVDDIVAAAGLVEPQHSMLSNFVLEQAPAHLRHKIRQLTGKVRALLDRKEREIHIDPTATTTGRVAFLKLHEVTHDILPWQKDLGFADDDAHLSASIRKLFEQQANCGAGELLFQREEFTGLARQYAIGMASILDLSRTVGSSAHATFRRYVECHDATVAGVVLEPSPCSLDPLAYRRREVIRSSEWERRFGSEYWPTVVRPEPFGFVSAGPEAATSGAAVRRQFVLPDVNNTAVMLNSDVYSNHYNLLALIWVPRREILRRRRILLPAGVTVRGA